MAAPKTPDPATLTSSAQVFAANHTLPQIRAIHKALHAQVDDKAARLRTQVGGSYRELLGTADGIVRMRGEMADVQAALGRMGARCGRAVVDGKVAGLGRFVREREGGTLGSVSRAKLLEASALTVARVLRAGAPPAAAAAADRGPGAGQEGSEKQTQEAVGHRLVVAAKVLVLGRLLVKTLGEETLDLELSAAVEASKKNLVSLRRRLLRRIDRVLEERVGDGVDRKDVLKALCAYSLATSSGARDALHHFLKVRGDAMALAFEVEGGGGPDRSAKDVLRSLGVYTKTLLDVQALVPNKLTEALAGLKRNGLLADESLRGLEGLRLDIHGRWCGDEIQYFKPYIRHDDLEGNQAKEMLTGWAQHGGEVLLDGLGKTLVRLTELKTVIEMRTEVLQLWIRDGGKAKGFDPSVMLDKLRRAINRHMLQVLDTKVGKLHLVSSEVSATLDAWQDGITDQQESLWDHESFDTELSDGAAHLAQDVISRLYGRNDAVSRAVASYESWHHIIDDVAEVVEQLRRQRWDNDIDEIEDEETIEQRQQLLSKEDPQMLADHLDASLKQAFEELSAQLITLWDAQKESPKNGHVAMYLVRVLRDIRSKLPKLKALEDFGLSIVPSLHAKIAAAVVVSPLEAFSASALTNKTVAGRSLWEGEPALPASPSPDAFRLLRDLTMAMGDAGMDLWSPAAVSVLKRHVGSQLAGLWRQALEAPVAGDQEKSNGETAEPTGKAEAPAEGEGGTVGTSTSVDAASQRKELLVQCFFDVSMLRTCLEATSDGPLKALEEDIYPKTGLESSEARQRMVKTSQDYWRRTSLLFDLLS